jgi:hypothetical protein
MASLNMPIDADDAVRWLMNEPGPACLEVVMDPNQLYLPRLQAIKGPEGVVSSPKLSELSPLFFVNDGITDNMMMACT